MRESIVMPEMAASVLCKFMERHYSGGLAAAAAIAALVPVRLRVWIGDAQRVEVESPGGWQVRCWMTISLWQSGRR
ncbi:hypothetical protein HFRIS_009934 [Herbaspirillum frisingense GSF30]|uniref:Uncharacterized protein n=1 Tax=Herbaspirillum frisingense GSF30 TaxID=864073 RepID=A0AAI9IEZ2_9BURK|nr:hypothetical protein HFRIS_009934 [Herbaspirillum frisingense GSF30]